MESERERFNRAKKEWDETRRMRVEDGNWLFEIANAHVQKESADVQDPAHPSRPLGGMFRY